MKKRGTGRVFLLFFKCSITVTIRLSEPLSSPKPQNPAIKIFKENMQLIIQKNIKAVMFNQQKESDELKRLSFWPDAHNTFF